MEVLARQKYEQEVLAARSKARERLEREERARLLNPAPVVSQRSLLLASKHLEDEKRKSKRFSKAEMATARSMLDRLNITKKTDMTETDTVKLKKQKSRGKVIQTILLLTRALKKCFTTISLLYLQISNFKSHSKAMNPRSCNLHSIFNSTILTGAGGFVQGCSTEDSEW